MRLVTLPAGSLVIDVNWPVTPALARAVRAAGYAGVMRYVPRERANSQDLTTAEISAVFNEGLVLGVVQHVKSEKSWVPTVGLGQLYGRFAMVSVDLLRLPSGTVIWCDLEGVDPTVSHAQTHD